MGRAELDSVSLTPGLAGLSSTSIGGDGRIDEAVGIS